MSSVSIRRALAGFAALAVAAVSAAALTTPAAAAPVLARADASLTMVVPDTSVPLGGTSVLLMPSWYADQDVVLQQPRLTYTLSGLDGVSVSNSDGDCQNASPTQLLCSSDSEFFIGPDGTTGSFTAALTAGESAVAGTAGAITVTFEADGIEPITQQAAVRVVEGVDLAAGPDVTLHKRPGASFDLPLVVRNAGPTVADGTAVIFNHDYAFKGTTQFSNCRYRDGEVTSCVFDQSLQPGGTLRGAMPYKLRADTYAPGVSVNQLQWLTPAELDDFEDLLQKNGQTLGAPGSGGVLRLQGTTAAAERQADTDPGNNWSTVEVRATGTNGADLVAIGDRLTGAVGDEVTAEVGVRNAGPATIDFNRSGESISHVAVTLPAGTMLLAAPEACSNDQGSRYLCSGSAFLPVGGTETYEFKLRITRVVPHAKGAVVVNGPCDCSQFTKDTNKTNNKTAIVLNPTGTGSGGGAGGGLPVTGPPAGAAGGAGLILLIGGAGMLTARRRRIRFVA